MFLTHFNNLYLKEKERYNKKSKMNLSQTLSLNVFYIKTNRNKCSRGKTKCKKEEFRRDSLGMRLRVAIDGYICAGWSANKLIRHPNHRRDCG